MCTLSWLPLPDGYLVAMNRDEQRSRAPGTPPQVRTVGGVTVLCPSDGSAGGTWVAANALGHSLALLNRYGDTPHDGPGDPVSRGLLVLELAGLPGGPLLDEALVTRELPRYRPFTLASLTPAAAPRLYEWNGRELTRSELAAPGLLRTSSGLDQAGAERARGEVFRRAALDPGLNPALLAELHQSHLPVRGALSVCMHRDDALTRSYSEIRVTGALVRFRQVEGPPCEGGPPVELELARRADA
jgi:hypothetical protein